VAMDELHHEAPLSTHATLLCGFGERLSLIDNEDVQHF
jgi:hypothetical protein